MLAPKRNTSAGPVIAPNFHFLEWNTPFKTDYVYPSVLQRIKPTPISWNPFFIGPNEPGLVVVIAAATACPAKLHFLPRALCGNA